MVNKFECLKNINMVHAHVLCTKYDRGCMNGVLSKH